MKFRSLLISVASSSALLMAACSSTPKTAETNATAPAASASASTPAQPPEPEKPAAAAPKKTDADTITCSLGDKDKRMIEIEADDAGCEVHYTKGDKTSTVATDKSGRGHCDKTVAKMRSKLVAAGYQCD